MNFTITRESIDGLGAMTTRLGLESCVIIVIKHEEVMTTALMRKNGVKKKDRLRGNFQRVLKTRVYTGGGLGVFATSGRGKIGVAVAKSVRGAVRRNRVKRKLREYARKKILGKTTMDVVLVAYGEKFSEPEIRW